MGEYSSPAGASGGTRLFVVEVEQTESTALIKPDCAAKNKPLPPSGRFRFFPFPFLQHWA